MEFLIAGVTVNPLLWSGVGGGFIAGPRSRLFFSILPLVGMLMVLFRLTGDGGFR